MMKTDEIIIIETADLIAAKKELIAKMKAETELAERAEAGSVILHLSTPVDDYYLFDGGCGQPADDLVDQALTNKLTWLIDHVYDQAIRAAEDKIESNVQQLKRVLITQQDLTDKE